MWCFCDVLFANLCQSAFCMRVYVSEWECVCLPPHPIWSCPCVLWPPVLKPINPTYTDSSHAVAVLRPTGITPFALKGSILFEDWSAGLVNTHSCPHPNISKWCIQIMSVISHYLYDCDSIYQKAVISKQQLFIFCQCIRMLSCSFGLSQLYHYWYICCLVWKLFLEISILVHLDL